MRKKLISTFQGNKNNPIYNWFEFTEAYSYDLVKEIFEKYPLKKDTKDLLVYDPFCGTGTTLLTAKEFGFNAIGTDVSYLMYLVSKSKTENYNLEKLNELLLSILKINKEIIPIKEEWIKKYFYSENLQDLIKIKKNIDLLKEKEKYFFYLVLLKTIDKIMNAKKNNASLIKVKKAKRITSKIFENIYKELIKDIIKTKINSDSKIEIYNESALKFLEKDLKFDYIICSPPYLNKTEYTKRYGIELAILEKETILKEHLGEINENYKKDYIYNKFFKKNIANLDNIQYKSENYDLQNYFSQLEEFISLSAEKLNKNGILSITIAGGILGRELFEIYDYMQEVYIQNKLKILNIKTNREILCHYNRSEKIGYIKEFTIIGKK